MFKEGEKSAKSTAEMVDMITVLRTITRMVKR